jgi:hypothetical protein
VSIGSLQRIGDHLECHTPRPTCVSCSSDKYFLAAAVYLVPSPDGKELYVATHGRGVWKTAMP